MKITNKAVYYRCLATMVWRRYWQFLLESPLQAISAADMGSKDAGKGAGNGRSGGSGNGNAGASDGGDMDDMEPVTPRTPVGSGTDTIASGEMGNEQYNVIGGTTSGGVNTDATVTGGAGAGSGAGDVNAVAGMGRSGILGSGTDNIRTTAQPGDTGAPMQANPGRGEGVTGGGAGAAYPDIDPSELGASPGQATNITPSGKVIDPDEEKER